jgi:hypothetical protein
MEKAAWVVDEIKPAQRSGKNEIIDIENGDKRPGCPKRRL